MIPIWGTFLKNSLLYFKRILQLSDFHASLHDLKQVPCLVYILVVILKETCEFFLKLILEATGHPYQS
jgi:hypothetical protein